MTELLLWLLLLISSRLSLSMIVDVRGDASN